MKLGQRDGESLDCYSAISFPQDLDGHVNPPLRQDLSDAVRPFDDHYAFLFQQLHKSNGFEIFGSVNAIRVEMKQRQPSAAIDVQKYESRAADGARVCAERGGKSADELGFAGAQLSLQRDTVAGDEGLCEFGCDGFGFRDAVGKMDHAIC